MISLRSRPQNNSTNVCVWSFRLTRQSRENTTLICIYCRGLAINRFHFVIELTEDQQSWWYVFRVQPERERSISSVSMPAVDYQA